MILRYLDFETQKPKYVHADISEIDDKPFITVNGGQTLTETNWMLLSCQCVQSDRKEVNLMARWLTNLHMNLDINVMLESPSLSI